MLLQLFTVHDFIFLISCFEKKLIFFAQGNKRWSAVSEKSSKSIKKFKLGNMRKFIYRKHLIFKIKNHWEHWTIIIKESDFYEDAILMWCLLMYSI